jgi:hypothetical protein
MACGFFISTPPVSFGCLGNDQRSWIKPLMRSRRATKCGTVQFTSSTGETLDLNLSAFKFSLANTANPLVIDRVPSPETIARTQNRQSIIKFDVSNHSPKSTLLGAWKQTIGTLDDCVIG